MATPTGWRPSTPSGSFRDTVFKQLNDAAANCKLSLTEQASRLLYMHIRLLCLLLLIADACSCHDTIAVETLSMATAVAGDVLDAVTNGAQNAQMCPCFNEGCCRLGCA